MEIFEGDKVEIKSATAYPLKNCAATPIYVNGIRVEVGETLIWDGCEYKIITSTSDD